jgi:hypothetical protein
MQARFIHSQQQAENYWLIQLELANATFESLPIGTQCQSDHQQAWLFQVAQTLNTADVKLTLLSNQAWHYPINQTLELTLVPSMSPIKPNWQVNQLWLGSDLAMAVVFDAAKRWQQAPAPKGQFIALLHSQQDFPFRVKPARFLVSLDNSASYAIGAAPLLEDWGIPNRLASSSGLAGCLDGNLNQLYQAWLKQNPNEDFEIVFC